MKQKNISTTFCNLYTFQLNFVISVKQKNKEMAEAIVSMVVGRITDLLIEEPLLLHRVEGKIQLVVTELMRLKTFLPDADSRIDEDKIRILLAEVLHLAYSAEHAVESFLVKAISYPGKTIQWMNTRKFLLGFSFYL